MKALRKLAAADEHLTLVDMPEPVARAGWVVLDVTYAGICGTDLHITHNAFPSWPPVTLGHEFTGRIQAVGPGVHGWAVGDRVVAEPHSLACGTCDLCRRGYAHLCPHKRSPGWGIDGGFAEQVAMPAHLLHHVPESVSDIGAGLAEPTAVVVTAYERMPVEPGSAVMVFGPGPIGILAALVAQAAGAGETVLVGRSSSAGRLELARSLGLTVWDSHALDVAAAARKVTEGRGVDLVVETSGSGEAVASGLAALRRRGRMCVLGVGSAPTEPVPWGLAMDRAVDVSFSLSSSASGWVGALALLARGAVDPAPLATVFPLESWAGAFEATTARTVVKALLQPARPSTQEMR